MEAADLFIIHGGWGGIAAGGPGALMLITPRPLLSPHTALLSLYNCLLSLSCASPCTSCLSPAGNLKVQQAMSPVDPMEIKADVHWTHVHKVHQEQEGVNTEGEEVGTSSPSKGNAPCGSCGVSAR